MSIQERIYSFDEFQAYVAQPENSDKLFELIHGEIIEVSPGRTRNSEIGHLIAIAVHAFCRTHQIPCHTSGGDGAYRVGNNVVAPDFAYKRTSMSDEYPDPVPPQWAVEVISPTDKAFDIRAKRQIYREAGILLWEIYPQAQSIDVYAPNQPARTAHTGETLDGGNVLPGFTLAVGELFAS
jgi:Uma2 family endonuclease